MARGGDEVRRSILLTMAFAVGWFVVENVFGHAISQQISLYQVVWTRYGVHLLLVALVWRKERFWQTDRPIYQLVRSALMLIMPLSFIDAIATGAPPMRIWAGFWVAPVLIVLFGWLLNRERATVLSLALACFGSAAAILVVGARPATGLTPLLLTFGMAGSFAAYIAMTRSLRTERVGSNLFYTAVVPFVALSFFMPFVWVTPDLKSLGAMAGIGGVGLFTLWILDRAAAAAPVRFGAPVVTILAAIPALLLLGLGATPLSMKLLAGLVVICAVVAVSFMRSRAPTPA